MPAPAGQRLFASKTAIFYGALFFATGVYLPFFPVWLAGQGLSEHSTPHDALVHVLEGSVEILIGGTPHRVKGGEVLLLPANIPHSLSALTAFKMLLVMIREPAA